MTSRIRGSELCLPNKGSLPEESGGLSGVSTGNGRGARGSMREGDRVSVGAMLPREKGRSDMFAILLLLLLLVFFPLFSPGFLTGLWAQREKEREEKERTEGK